MAREADRRDAEAPVAIKHSEAIAVSDGDAVRRAGEIDEAAARLIHLQRVDAPIVEHAPVAADAGEIDVRARAGAEARPSDRECFAVEGDIVLAGEQLGPEVEEALGRHLRDTRDRAGPRVE